MLRNLRRRLSADMGIDLGTTNTVVSLLGEGIVLNQPTVVAIKKADGQVVAIGEEARRMEGRTPKGIRTIRPMQDGVIAEFDVVELMIKHFIREVSGRRISRPRIVVGIPSGITVVERRAVMDACRSAGASEVWLVYESFAGALGSGVPVFDPAGNMVVDIGGGTTEVSVISLGAMVESRSIRVGGNVFISSIVNHVKTDPSKALIIGSPTAEDVYRSIGHAMPSDQPETFQLRGREVVSGLPKTIEVSSHDVRGWIEEPLAKVIEVIRQTLDDTPPELAADIVDRGIVLFGGGSMLRGLPEFIHGHTKVPVRLADEPLLCVAHGTQKYLELKLDGDPRVADTDMSLTDDND